MRLRVRGAGAVQPRGELIEVGLADEDGPGVEQPLHGRRGAVGDVRVPRAGERGGQPGNVQAVLDPERDAVQWQRFRVRAALEILGSKQHLGLVDQGDPGAVVAALGDASQHALDDGRRGGAP